MENESINKTKIKNADKRRLWEIYLACFKSSSSECAQEQRCYSKKTFYKALKDKDYYKFILSVKGKIIGFSLVTNNLKKARVAYIKPERYKKIFPEHGIKNKIFYITFIGIDPAHHKQMLNFFNLVSPVIKFIVLEGGIAAFDFSREKNGQLPQMLQRAFDLLIKRGEIKGHSVTYSTVDIQEYGAFETF